LALYQGRRIPEPAAWLILALGNSLTLLCQLKPTSVLAVLRMTCVRPAPGTL
jgi:hypothetical protein